MTALNQLSPAAQSLVRDLQLSGESKTALEQDISQITDHWVRALEGDLQPSAKDTSENYLQAHQIIACRVVELWRQSVQIPQNTPKWCSRENFAQYIQTSLIPLKAHEFARRYLETLVDWNIHRFEVEALSDKDVAPKLYLFHNFLGIQDIANHPSSIASEFLLWKSHQPAEVGDLEDQLANLGLDEQKIPN